MHNLEVLSPATGYDALQLPFDTPRMPLHVSFAPNAAYGRYFRMHKVLVGDSGAQQLEAIHEDLEDEFLPRYLVASASAAAESALVRRGTSVENRLGLLDRAVQAWQRSIVNQQWLNEHGPEHFRDHALPYRSALDIAVVPLLRGVVQGDVTDEQVESSFRDSLQIAQLNALRIEIMAKAGDRKAVSEHTGFGYECNALLAFNRQFSHSWFMIPAMARCDSGMEYNESTHDLLVVHQKHGAILSATPAEIKASASRADRNRYNALLVRGKMHLAVPGKYTPRYTLEAIAACYEGRAGAADQAIADGVTGRLSDMVRDYYAGDMLGPAATWHTLTSFRDGTVVAQNHPGLQRSRERVA